MGDVISFPDAEQRASDRLGALVAKLGVNDAASSLGSPEDWAWSAVIYLKGALYGTQNGTKGGEVVVSAAAVGLLLGYVEDLAGQLGIIPSPSGPEAA